jgi:bifunctional DNA-binding transcriptional regulator/antitoxin component of YhaV-PrlF toxin-antitoxin module
VIAKIGGFASAAAKHGPYKKGCNAHSSGDTTSPEPSLQIVLFCIMLKSTLENMAMATLSVTARGQVTLGKDVLEHLGIQPGDRIRLDLLPNGKAQLKAEKPKGSWRNLHGLLRGKGNDIALEIDDINAAIAEGAAKAGMAGLGN